MTMYACMHVRRAELRPQPDVSGPGFFSDGDMLQTCNFGFGGTNCEASKPGSCPNKGHMKQGEYQAQFATFALLASQVKTRYIPSYNCRPLVLFLPQIQPHSPCTPAA
jgi:hypothetical protein